MHAPAYRGLLLVLSAPSGTGKTSLARKLIETRRDGLFAISFTTRRPRGPEQDGVDYHFVDVRTFQQKIEAGEFVEWAEVHGHFYGSPQAVVDHARSQNGVAVFDIDVQGGQAIKRKHPDAVLVFVLPPSLDELERRLRLRRTDPDEIIRRRMLAARSEIERGLASYDYVIVNDDFDRAFGELSAIVAAERCRRDRVDLSRLQLDAPTGPPGPPTPQG